MKKIISMLVIILSLLGVLFVYYNEHKFTIKKWNNIDKRGKIVLDLLKKYDIYSMDKNEILSLLGNPLPKSNYPSRLVVISNEENNKAPRPNEMELSSENTIIYPLSSKLSVYEGSGLYIKFGENQKPAYCSIVFFST